MRFNYSEEKSKIGLKATVFMLVIKLMAIIVVPLVLITGLQQIATGGIYNSKYKSSSKDVTYNTILRLSQEDNWNSRNELNKLKSNLGDQVIMLKKEKNEYDMDRVNKAYCNYINSSIKNEMERVLGSKFENKDNKYIFSDKLKQEIKKNKYTIIFDEKNVKETWNEIKNCVFNNQEIVVNKGEYELDKIIKELTKVENISDNLIEQWQDFINKLENIRNKNKVSSGNINKVLDLVNEFNIKNEEKKITNEWVDKFSKANEERDIIKLEELYNELYKKEFKENNSEKIMSIDEYYSAYLLKSISNMEKSLLSLDLREKDKVGKNINWDLINGNPESDLQGIVTFKRAFFNGDIETMYQGNLDDAIEKYKETPTEENRKAACILFEPQEEGKIRVVDWSKKGYKEIYTIPPGSKDIIENNVDMTTTIIDYKSIIKPYIDGTIAAIYQLVRISEYNIDFAMALLDSAYKGPIEFAIYETGYDEELHTTDTKTTVYNQGTKQQYVETKITNEEYDELEFIDTILSKIHTLFMDYSVEINYNNKKENENQSYIISKGNYDIENGKINRVNNVTDGNSSLIKIAEETNVLVNFKLYNYSVLEFLEEQNLSKTYIYDFLDFFGQIINGNDVELSLEQFDPEPIIIKKHSNKDDTTKVIGANGKEIDLIENPILEMDVPINSEYGTTYKYCPWQAISAKSSYQYKLIEHAGGFSFDEEGFGEINGRYVVAVTRNIGQVGDIIDYYYEDKDGNEKVIPCIIGDIKAEHASGGTGGNKFGHDGGKNILEFYVDAETWVTPGFRDEGGKPVGGGANKMHENNIGNGCRDEWGGHAIKIVNGGNYDETFKQLKDRSK